jgi:hypothetical protein
MWIKTSERGNGTTLMLTCDECGAVFRPDRPHRNGGDRSVYWHSANIAGWVRIGRAPDRHVCSSC